MEEEEKGRKTLGCREVEKSIKVEQCLWRWLEPLKRTEEQEVAFSSDVNSESEKK